MAFETGLLTFLQAIAQTEAVQLNVFSIAYDQWNLFLIAFSYFFLATDSILTEFKVCLLSMFSSLSSSADRRNSAKSPQTPFLLQSKSLAFQLLLWLCSGWCLIPCMCCESCFRFLPWIVTRGYAYIIHFNRCSLCFQVPNCISL